MLIFENDLLRVGPESSGAYPGPVCYGYNGHLSITDANLILGKPFMLKHKLYLIHNHNKKIKKSI